MEPSDAAATWCNGEEHGKTGKVPCHPWDGGMVNFMSRPPATVEELYDGPQPEIEDHQLQKRISELLKDDDEWIQFDETCEEEEEEEDAVKESNNGKTVQFARFPEENEEEEEDDDDDDDVALTQASLWYFIIYEQIKPLAKYTLYFDRLNQHVYRKEAFKFLDGVFHNCTSLTSKQLMKKLLNAMEENYVSPEEVVRAMIEYGVPILRRGLTACWVSMIELFKHNKQLPGIIKEWIHDNSPLNLNIHDEQFEDPEKFRLFPEFMATQDDFHLSFILCAIKDAISADRCTQEQVPFYRKELLGQLFAMAGLYYTTMFRPEGLSICRFSLWSPQCLCHSPEDKGQYRTPATDRGIKLVRNAEGKVVLGPTTYEKEGEFGVPIYFNEVEHLKVVAAENEKLVEKQNQIIKNLRVQLDNQIALTNQLKLDSTE